jgi:hypothetical protein
MASPVIRFIVSPWGISILHLLVGGLALSAFGSEFFRPLFTFERPADFDHFREEAGEVLEGLAIILIGYGMALEEREFFRRKAGLLAAGDPARQEQLDDSCHQLGVVLLLLGLFSEIPVSLVEMPNSIFDTSGTEMHMLALSMGFQLVATIFLLRHLIKMSPFGRSAAVA